MSFPTHIVKMIISHQFHALVLVIATFTITRKRLICKYTDLALTGQDMDCLMTEESHRVLIFCRWSRVMPSSEAAARGSEKQTRGAGRQLLLHLTSLGTPPPTPPFPRSQQSDAGTNTNTEIWIPIPIQIQLLVQIWIQIQIQVTNYYYHISPLSPFPAIWSRYK